MASVFYGINRGQSDAQPYVVVEGASTNATDIELRIDTGKGLTKREVDTLTGNIIRYILDTLKPGGATYPDL